MKSKKVIRLTMQSTSANRKKTTLFIPRNTPNSQPSIKRPLYHDLRGPLLKGVVHDVHKNLFEIKADWKLYGCSIMADRWSNRRNVSIVNFLTYSPRGTIFLKLDVTTPINFPAIY
ncbi:hypothetical protein NC652_031661 [Populus alba x Populus x berolinensis]|nr:hypothetical protein NC652_031661 [Populus alba x Populus x berolinensis]